MFIKVVNSKSFFIVLLLLLVYSTAFTLLLKDKQDENVITDVARLMPTKIKKLIKDKEEWSLIETIKEANQSDLKVSIAGKRHSQGGHTYYPDAIVLDMTEFNQVLHVDPDKKTSYMG